MAEIVQLLLFRDQYDVDKDDCWIWKHRARPGQTSPRVTHRTKSMTPRRALWLIHRGDIPYDHRIMSKCGQRWCVNPDHSYIELKPPGQLQKINASTTSERDNRISTDVIDLAQHTRWR